MLVLWTHNFATLAPYLDRITVMLRELYIDRYYITDGDVWFKADTFALQLIAKHMNLNHFYEVYLSDVSVNQHISTIAVSTSYM